MTNVPAPVAHAGTLISIVSWVAALAAAAEPIVSVVCGLVGIVSGCFAIAYYHRRLKGRP